MLISMFQQNELFIFTHILQPLRLFKITEKLSLNANRLST